MFETIKQHYSRPLSIFNITREDVKGMFYWFAVISLCDMGGLPDGLTGIVVGFILGLPLYVWLFHMGEEKEPTPDA